MQVTIHPEAAREMHGAVDYYEERNRGLGGFFLEELEDGIKIILSNPEAFPIVESIFRKYCLNHFPFNLFYIADRGTLRIMAVAHQHRKPGYWTKRYKPS